MNSSLQYISSMMASIYYKSKHIFTMFYDKVYFTFYCVKPPLNSWKGDKIAKISFYWISSFWFYPSLKFAILAHIMPVY